MKAFDGKARRTWGDFERENHLFDPNRGNRGFLDVAAKAPKVIGPSDRARNRKLANENGTLLSRCSSLTPLFPRAALCSLEGYAMGQPPGGY